MYVKFKIASFRETDRTEVYSPISIGLNGVHLHKEQKRHVWDYQLTDTNGKEWMVYGQRTRGGYRKGQVIRSVASTRGGDGSATWLGKQYTESEFLKQICEAIDRRKKEIEKAQKEIEYLRAL